MIIKVYALHFGDNNSLYPLDCCNETKPLGKFVRWLANAVFKVSFACASCKVS